MTIRFMSGAESPWVVDGHLLLYSHIAFLLYARQCLCVCVCVCLWRGPLMSLPFLLGTKFLSGEGHTLMTSLNLITYCHISG